MGYWQPQSYKVFSCRGLTTLKTKSYRQQYEEFLRRLRRARVDAKLTQAQVARSFGRPQSFISKCESGERRVDIVELRHFVSLYKKPLTFFID